MLVQMAVGDALGAGFEYAPAGEVAKFNNLSGYRQHQKHLDIKPGCYTDDTQMAIAVAEFLIEPGSAATTDIAHFFVRAFKRDKRSGYAGSFYDLLDKQIRDAFDFVALVEPDSRKSGGAMRAGPMGLLKDVTKCIDWAMWQASLTHATRDGMNAAAAAALMVHYFYYFRGIAGAKENLPAYLEANLPGYDWVTPHTGPVGSSGIVAVKAALAAIVDGKDLSDILRRCIAFTGDVDTVAAIALCAASWSDEIDQTLPQVLLDTLENGTYGRDFLAKLDAKLVTRFPRPVLAQKPVVDWTGPSVGASEYEEPDLFEMFKEPEDGVQLPEKE